MTYFPPLLINMCSYGHPTQRQNGEYYNRFALPAIILAFYVIRPIWEINGAVVEVIADEKYSFYTEFTGGTKYANEELPKSSQPSREAKVSKAAVFRVTQCLNS